MVTLNKLEGLTTGERQKLRAALLANDPTLLQLLQQAKDTESQEMLVEHLRKLARKESAEDHDFNLNYPLASLQRARFPHSKHDPQAVPISLLSPSANDDVSFRVQMQDNKAMPTLGKSTQRKRQPQTIHTKTTQMSGLLNELEALHKRTEHRRLRSEQIHRGTFGPDEVCEAMSAPQLESDSIETSRTDSIAHNQPPPLGCEFSPLDPRIPSCTELTSMDSIIETSPYDLFASTKKAEGRLQHSDQAFQTLLRASKDYLKGHTHDKSTTANTPQKAELASKPYANTQTSLKGLFTAGASRQRSPAGDLNQELEISLKKETAKEMSGRQSSLKNDFRSSQQTQEGQDADQVYANTSVSDVPPVFSSPSPCLSVPLCQQQSESAPGLELNSISPLPDPESPRTSFPIARTATLPCPDSPIFSLPNEPLNATELGLDAECAHDNMNEDKGNDEDINSDRDDEEDSLATARTQELYTQYMAKVPIRPKPAQYWLSLGIDTRLRYLGCPQVLELLQDPEAASSYPAFFTALQQTAESSNWLQTLEALNDSAVQSLYAVFKKESNGSILPQDVLGGISLLCQDPPRLKIQTAFRYLNAGTPRNSPDGDCVSLEGLKVYLRSVFAVLTSSSSAAGKAGRVSAQELSELTALQCFEDTGRSLDDSIPLEAFIDWFTVQTKGLAPLPTLHAAQLRNPAISNRTAALNSSIDEDDTKVLTSRCLPAVAESVTYHSLAPTVDDALLDEDDLVVELTHTANMSQLNKTFTAKSKGEVRIAHGLPQKGASLPQGSIEV